MFVSRLLSRLVRSTEASHIGHDGARARRQESANKSSFAFGGRVGERKCPAEHVAEHCLVLFKDRKNVVELAELSEPIDEAAVEQHDGRSFTLVVVCDLDA